MKLCAFIASALALSAPVAGAETKKKVPPALDFTVKDINGKDVHLGTYHGKVLLIVNVASRCGLTDRQYARLQSLYEKYQKRGFEILAFPANDFGNQEPGPEAEIKAFCEKKGVTFPVFSKISVKGEKIHPLYKYLTSKETAGKFAGEIRWNFDKFLIGRDGTIAARFEPAADPLSKEATEAIEKELERAAEPAEKKDSADKA